MSRRIVNFIGVITTGAVLIGLPVAYSNYQIVNYRNVRIVTPGVLYRSGQLTQAGLARMVHDHGIRTVVSLRDSYVDKVDLLDGREPSECAKMDVKHVRIAPKSWWPEYDGPPQAEQGVMTFLKVMDDPANYPVLLHCFAGTHRTGAMIAIYRMEYDRWTNSEALAELRQAGYKNLDNELDVLTYLENYKPRWMR